MRNLLTHSPVKHRSEMAAGARLVQQVQDLVEAKRRLSEFVERFGKSAPKAVVDEFAEWAAARAAAGNGNGNNVVHLWPCAVLNSNFPIRLTCCQAISDMP